MAVPADFQRLHNTISNNLTKIGNNGALNRLENKRNFTRFLASDLERLVQKLGTPEDSEPLRER